MLPQVLLSVTLAITPTWVRKNCTYGKPCGNTCISQNETCHVGSFGSESNPDTIPHLVVGGAGAILLLWNIGTFLSMYPQNSPIEDGVRARWVLGTGVATTAVGVLYTGIGGALISRDSEVPEHLLGWGIPFMVLGVVHLIFGVKLRRDLALMPSPGGLVFRVSF